MLTTVEAAALLAERGVVVKADTVKHWCQQGKFPGAKAPANQRGVWLIPREDLDNFQPPKIGRPGKGKAMETWYADGVQVQDEATARRMAREFVQVDLINDAGELVHTRWDVRPAEARGHTDNDRVERW